MIKSKIFLTIISIELVVFAAMLVHGQVQYFFKKKEIVTSKQHLVSQIGLTDFAIWTEARYTRHPSQADFFSPFQDSPGLFEHFPAGAIIAPPLHLTDRRDD